MMMIKIKGKINAVAKPKNESDFDYGSFFFFVFDSMSTGATIPGSEWTWE